MQRTNDKQADSFTFLSRITQFKPLLLAVASLLLIFLCNNNSFSADIIRSAKFEPDSIKVNVDTQVSRSIKEAEKFWKDNDNENAAITAESVFALTQNIHDSTYANLLHVYGKVLIDQQENSSGIDSLLKCVQLKSQIFNKSHYSLSKTYNYIGIGYFQKRDYLNASKYYKLSADILIRNNLWTPNLYDSYMNMGILEAIQGKYGKAFRYFDTTRIVLDSIGPKVDSLLIARFYLNYGNLATLNGRLEEGNKYFNIAERIYIKEFGQNSSRIPDLNLNKGLNAYYSYDFDRSKLYYKKALEVYGGDKETNIRLPRVYMNLGAVSIKSGNYLDAIQYSKLGLTYDPPDELKWLLYSNLTQAYIALNDDQNALLYFDMAMNLEEEGNISSVKKINLFMEFANFLLAKGRNKESKYYYEEALRLIANSYGMRSAVYANGLSKLGDYYLQNSLIDSSMYYYNESIRLWSFAPGSSGASQVTFNEVRFAEAYIGRAKALYQKHLLTEKIEFLAAANSDIQMILERMEQVSNKLDKESKLLLFDQLKPAYNLATEIAFEQYKLDPNGVSLQDAFNYMERSKSSVLLSSIRNLDALNSTDVPENVMRLEKRLNEEINGLRQMLADEKQKKQPARGKVTFFESKLLNLLIEHDSLVGVLEENYPRYYSLKYDRSTIQLSELAEKMNTNEAIIEYEISDSTLYIMGITKERVGFLKSSLDSTFWNSLNYMLTVKDVDISQFRTQEINTFYKHSRSLWHILIEPIYHQINNKKLVIIPDGVLGYLPFEILANRADQVDDVNFKTMPYLLKEFPVSYSYSATLKYNPYFAKSRKNNNELIAFAPNYSQQSEGNLKARSFALDNLPNAKQEVFSIEEMWEGDLYVGIVATKTNFLEDAGDYNVIHLAMHAMINDSVPMFSKLVFSASDDTVSSILNTYEIYDLDLNASMVTLSACNTGTGIFRNGEGIMSLARGFIYAGVPSIVMTLWEVQDKSGSEIMTMYYENLKKGDSKDIALQKAKLEFLNNSPDYSTHPFYWSAYIITGDTQQLIINKRPVIYSLISGIGILLVIIILWVFIKHKKRSGKTI